MKLFIYCDNGFALRLRGYSCAFVSLVLVDNYGEGFNWVLFVNPQNTLHNLGKSSNLNQCSAHCGCLPTDGLKKKTYVLPGTCLARHFPGEDQGPWTAYVLSSAILQVCKGAKGGLWADQIAGQKERAPLTHMW